jgi:LysR family transcriptional regulator, low CO2-responsive transcriptional regulator
MTLSQYSFFATVAKHQSVSRASEELRVSQPSISQQLRQLESRHGFKLYRRLSRGIEITEQGQALLRDITPILEQVSKLESGFNARPRRLVPQVLKVGGTFSASAEILPRVLARLQQCNPEAELECRTGRSERLERLVLESAMDLAVIARSASSEALVSEPLAREKVVLFVRADHRFAKMVRMRPAELAGESFIVRGGRGISGVTESAVKQLQDRGVELKIGLRSDNPAAVMAAVRHGMGVGVAFENTVKAAVSRREFAILKVIGLKLSGETFIIYAKKRPLSPLAQEFLELMREERRKRKG